MIDSSFQRTIARKNARVLAWYHALYTWKGHHYALVKDFDTIGLWYGW
jgi:hypothetical protein